MKKTDFNIEISIDNVLNSVGVSKESELYEEVLEELQMLLPLAQKKINPIALLGIGNLENQKVIRDGKIITDVLYSICSLGKEMEAWSTLYFSEGDYLKGMLVDAIADDYLFQMDGQLEEAVIELSRSKKKGIVGRAEIPKDLPMNIQKDAYDATNAMENGISIKPSYMYDPVKTLCSVYLLDENEKRFSPEHDCNQCENVTCKRRRTDVVSVSVHICGEVRVIRAKKTDSLLTTLQKHHIYLPAICAGRGTCGKCKVQVLSGKCPVSNADKKYFLEKEIEEGWRLACCFYPLSDCEIVTTNNEEDIYVVTAQVGRVLPSVGSEDMTVAIAADIGTTTIAMQLVELSSGNIIDTYTSINKQRTFGADVISRINASNNGKKEELRAIIQKDLYEGIQSLTKSGEIRVEKMVIAANTTMVHLLMGYSCETLGVYPFQPINIETIYTDSNQLISGALPEFPITISPGISTYVGGDITSGLYALDFHKKDRVSVLIDLGTNGEMAIGNCEKIYVTSTAAGPAFEGGNIVHGTGSIPGAICNVSMDEKENVHVKTIGEKEPIGICGTGVLETTYELLKIDAIDDTGRMDDPYFEEGFLLSSKRNIRFYQKDVREIQLAKSAVRAGLETLILKYGITYDEIEHIYIAGGFGYKINVEKAIQIGLFPEECAEKIIAVGNSCLKGTIKSLLDVEAEQILKEIVKHSEEIELSSDKNFQQFYVEYMMF